MPETLSYLNNEDPVIQPGQRMPPEKSWRPPAGVRMISADDHIEEVEDLWQERMAAKWKDRAPKLWFDKGTGWKMEIEGRSVLAPGIESQKDFATSRGSHDPAARVAVMDSEGIEASVIYPGRAMVLNATQDNDLYIAAVDAFNEWFAEHVRGFERRLLPVAMLSAWRKPEIARDRLQMIRQLGFRIVQLPNYPRGVRYNSREMDGLFGAIEESGLTLAFHVGPVLEFVGTGSLGANCTRNFSPFRPLLGQLMFSGVLERHPALKVAFVEGGATWAAHALTDMDHIHRVYHATLRPRLAKKPSFYWHRQCSTSFMYDPCALRLADVIGVDNLIWSTDYPHNEGVYGFAGEIAEDIWKQLGPDAAAKVLGGNAARMWNIDPLH